MVWESRKFFTKKKKDPQTIQLNGKFLNERKVKRHYKFIATINLNYKFPISTRLFHP